VAAMYPTPPDETRAGRQSIDELIRGMAAPGGLICWERCGFTARPPSRVPGERASASGEPATVMIVELGCRLSCRA
jgi:hypothetical protein